MLCAKCGKEKGINDMLLCEYCYNIKQTTNNIILIAWKSIDNYSDRVKIEKIVEDIYIIKDLMMVIGNLYMMIIVYKKSL